MITEVNEKCASLGSDIPEKPEIKNTVHFSQATQ